MDQDHISEQKCEQCGAALRYDPERAMLVCDSCGNTIEIKEETVEEIQVEGLDFNQMRQQVTDEDAEALPIYNCLSCGAEVIAPPEQMALTCPYCGNNIVLTDKVSGKLRPDGIIPFRITSKQLPDAMNNYYKDKELLPGNFFSEQTMSKVTGVYVPFWIFNGRMTGVLRFTGTRSTSSRHGDYIVTHTGHYSMTRDVNVPFVNVPVDASGKIDDDLMDSLEPFNMQDVKPFDMRYLAGFTADRFDQDKGDVSDRAMRRMTSTTERVVAQSVSGYAGAVRTGGNLRAEVSARYMLLPVYMFDILYGGEKYHFAVNGQSGKIIGNLPVDKGKSSRYFWKRFGIAAGIIIAIIIIKYLLGA